MASKCVLIVLDGLADRSFEVLGHKTPLQAARTPTLDALASRGATGMFHADRVGIPLSSQDAHFSIYGYDPHEIPKRGILEAVAAGVEVGPNDVSMLARLVAASNENCCLRIVDRRPPVTEQELAGLMAHVESHESRGILFRFHQVALHEGILVLKGDVSPRITDTDPLCNGLFMPDVRPWTEASTDRAAALTAAALKDYLAWTHRKLSTHSINLAREKRGESPLNAFITHLADRPRTVESFRDRWGFTALSISPKLVQWGVAAFLRMDAIKARDSLKPEVDIAERIAMATESLSRYDWIHVHSMAPDQAAHTKNPVTKVSVIESLDRGIGQSIDRLLQNPDVLVVITADHSTPSSGGLIHSGETVPLLMLGEGVRRDGVKYFDEVQCAQGALGQLRGKELMFLIVNHLDRAMLRGIRHSPAYRHYWPSRYEPFRLD